MSAIDDLTAVPDQPQISEGNKTFSQKTFALWLWIRTKLVPAMVELRDLIVSSVTGAFSGTSTTSVVITDTGEVSITTNAGRSFKPGTPVRLANVADPRKYIDGITKTYDSSTGALVFYAQAKAGSGTYTDWSLIIIPSGGGLAGLGSNTFVGNQFVPDESYDASGWNGDLSVPTKKSVRDKIEALAATILVSFNATNDSGFSSTSSTSPASPEWIRGLLNKLLSFGGGNNWLDVVASRAFNTNYTNTTGRTKYVSISVLQGSGGSGTFYCDGVALGVSTPSTVGEISTISEAIPHLSTYSYNVSAGVQTKNRWSEGG